MKNYSETLEESIFVHSIMIVYYRFSITVSKALDLLDEMTI